MRSSAVGPDRAVDRSSAPPPANLYACHEVIWARPLVGRSGRIGLEICLLILKHDGIKFDSLSF
jgi:hypothetical protein